MRGKLLFVAGIAAGYVIGARAGRPAYDAITDRVQGFRENPTVQKVGGKAKEAIEDKAPGISETVSKVAETATAAASAAGSAGTDSEDSSDSGSPAAAASTPEAVRSGSPAPTPSPAPAPSPAPTPSPKPSAAPKAPASSKTGGPANSSGAASGAEGSSAPGSAG